MKKTCEFCSGCGQINYFKGVSRFLISTDECQECGGTGFQITEDEKGEKKNSPKKKTGK